MQAHLANVRILTWNIHGGGLERGDRDLVQVVSLVRRHDPDIVALQEIDARGLSRPSTLAFEYLKESLGTHSAEARIITAPDGDYGHALISRWPLDAAVQHDLSFARREPRAAIEATVRTAVGPLHVVAVHLGLSFSERKHQAALLARVAQEGPPNSVVIGDFNDWLWGGAVQRSLAKRMSDRTRHKTFPSWLPVLALDRIYSRPAGLLIRSWTDPSARQTSDHLPVVADLALR